MLLLSNQNMIEQWGPQHPGHHNPAVQALCVQLGAAWGITVVFMTKCQRAHSTCHKPCLQALCVQLGAAWGITAAFMTKCQRMHGTCHKPCLQALCVQLGAAWGITAVFMTKCQWAHSACHKPCLQALLHQLGAAPYKPPATQQVKQEHHPRYLFLLFTLLGRKQPMPTPMDHSKSQCQCIPLAQWRKKPALLNYLKHEWAHGTHHKPPV